ncbi:FAD-dependent oxidoreductase [Paraburkholderia saeva]|uniref:FAD-dependent oxidoreductase n=1 Tax=Paraburkholderia saeva TaxID=2777537 RepID=UPI001DE21C43|nr:FAD-dependent oxidoreductase [Paraburkholderia saeva]CAG4889901.1 3-phenylpropionate/cinnamic acid dioxygenase ferredoxin--NAD(+) reductase component [Paraburkholderia saeva]CAG4897427.1 3-phenylpropionate/cinnamic acid dioxygenase ferredoxin--NAD(+) reductase component [Paraburkholderia saeva]
MSPAIHQVARVEDLPTGRGTRVCVRHDGKEVPLLLVRDGDTVRAWSADCPHAGAPLEEGTICNGRLVCPWHKGTFDLNDGSIVEPPPLKPLTRYAATVRDGNVFVSLETEEDARTQRIKNGSTSRTVLIAGAGAAGAAASAALREAGFEGRIVLAGGDAREPYDRTSLSKFVVAGDMPVDDVPPLLDPDFFATQKIERIESRVARLDANAKRAELDDGTAIDYDAALVCTGGTPKPPDIPGTNLTHVHLLRNRDDARAILASLDDAGAQGAAKRVVIAGASFIGLEVAGGLRKRNIDVHVICPADVPFAKQFGVRIGERIKRLHEENGVIFHTRARVSALRGDRAVREVVLDTGEHLPADVVIAATGVTPATSFLSGIQLNDDRSVTVDAGMMAAPGLYAAGDVARFPLPRSQAHVRIEHWRVAQQLARVAAMNIAGEPCEYVGVPYFWTWHYEKTIDYLGHVDDPDSVEIDGDLDALNFIAYLVKDGEVRAIVACERGDATGRLSEAMREPLTLEEARRIAEA